MTFKKITPRGLLVVFIVVAALIIITTLNYYVGAFGGLGSSASEWAQFGNFFGGTLGPIFSLLAFVGLLWNISLFYEQLSQANDDKKNRETQQKKDDLFRIIEVIYKEINQRLATMVEPLFMYGREPVSIEQFIKNPYLPDEQKRIVAKYPMEFSDLSNLVHKLKIYLEEYEKCSSTKAVSEYYKFYFYHLAKFLESDQKIDSEISEFYKNAVDTHFSIVGMLSGLAPAETVQS